MTTIRPATKKGRGIYFNPATMELLRVDDAVVDPGPGWKKFSDDPSLGLLTARRELEDQRLIKDASGVEWFGLSASDPLEAEALSEFIARFKRDSKAAIRQARSKSSFLHRLAERLRSILEGSTRDGGDAGSLAPVPVRSVHDGGTTRVSGRIPRD